MTEKIIIFIIVGSVIVAVTLIAALMQIVKSICEASMARSTAYSLSILEEMGVTYGEIQGIPSRAGDTD